MKHIVTIFFLFLFLLTTTSTIFSQDLSGFTFCIDPGHSPTSDNQGPGRVREYSVNLKVAQYLQSYLIAAKADTVIIITPESNSPLSLSEREDIANLNGVDRFYSIHHNLKNDSDQNSNFNILKKLQMPGQVSSLNYEYDSIEENKLFNDDFLRFEALSYFKSILASFEQDDVEYASLRGIVYKSEDKLPINGAQVNIFSLDLSYNTDNFDNGFYAFPVVNPGKVILEASAPGYTTQLDTINLDSTDLYSHDFYLIKNISPYVQRIIPDTNQFFSPYDNIKIEFNRQMNAKSVEQALKIEPEFSYQVEWLDENKTLQIDPDPILKFNSEIHFFIDTTAKDIFNHSLDSSPEDLLHDPFMVRLKTEPVDFSKLQILSVLPINLSQNIFIGDVINIKFNKALDAKSLNNDNIYLARSENEKVNVSFSSSFKKNGTNILQLIPMEPLDPDIKYTLFISREVSDSSGNKLENDFQCQFFTERSSQTYYILDDFSEGVTNWFAPKESSFSRNFEFSRTDWLSSGNYQLRDTTSVGQLNFDLQPDGLIDLTYKSSPYKFENLQTDDIIGAYIFGDSSLIQFRFYFSDSSDGFEAGPWKRINWIGWKPVYYQIGVDSVVKFAGGDGFFNGEIGFAGFQLYSSTNRTGTVYFDDLFLLTSRITSVADEEEINKPKDYILIESYPSPFSRNLGHAGVTFTYEFPAEWGTSLVNLTIFNTLGQKVRELINQPLSPGSHQIFWNGLDKNNQNLPAGIYFIRVQIGKEIQTRRLTILN